MAKSVLVFDFGALTSRAMLCRYDVDKLSLEEVLRFPNRPIMEDGHLRWDIDDLFENMKTGIGFGVFNGGFDAISIDAWGVDFGLIGQNGELLENPVHYRDSRTSGIAEKVFSVRPADELYKQSGILPQNINTIFQLAYLAENESNTLFRAESMLMIPDLFAYLLTGKRRNEYTEATTSQLISAKTKNWNGKLAEALNIPSRIFCPLIQPGDVYGMLKEEIAEEYRCVPVPVIACPSHDTASAVLAVPSESERFCFISCGTWMLFGTEISRPIISEEAMKMGFTNEGGYGGTTTLVKNITGLWLIQESLRYYNDNCANYSYSDPEAAAREASPFVSFINPNDPLFAAPDDMPLKIQEFCRKTNQPVPESTGEVLRCIYQSIACEFALTLESLETLTETRFDKINMIGGGIRDKLLCELTAAALGRTAVAGPAEATALGNGISSLIALGEIKDIKTARKIVIESGLTEEFAPIGHEEWKSALEKYKAIVR